MEGTKKKYNQPKDTISDKPIRNDDPTKIIATVVRQEKDIIFITRRRVITVELF